MNCSSEGAKLWHNGLLILFDAAEDDAPGNTLPSRPIVNGSPPLVAPNKVPSMRSSGVSPAVYILLNLAHIELTAVHCYWDSVGRFAKDRRLPAEYYDDFVGIIRDETRHFLMIRERLQQLGHAYGELPAHASLWNHAEATSGDLLARLAVVPMVQEARGLDAGPRFVAKLRQEGDKESAAIVAQIAEEEIEHVAIGHKWFQHICNRDNLHPQ